MEEYEYEDDFKGETQSNVGLYINGINYSYSISKSEKDKDSLIIKLFDSTNKSNNYYTYEGNITKIKKDIKYIDFCENLDEIISLLNDIFNKRNVQIEEKHGEYKLKLTFNFSGITKLSTIQLTKNNNTHEIQEAKTKLEDKINKLENNYKDLNSKYEELKVIKENEIRKIVKEVIFDKEIKLKLFEDMEQMFLSKYNLNTNLKISNKMKI